MNKLPTKLERRAGSFTCRLADVMQLFPFAGGSAEPADVHGVLLLPLLHGGQSLHRAAQVNTHTHTRMCVYTLR